MNEHSSVVRFFAAIVGSCIFAGLPYIAYSTRSAWLDSKERDEKSFYNNVNLVEWLDASLVVEIVDAETFRVTFTRNAPFDIAATQVQQVQMFCDGFPYQMRTREPFHVAIDEGYRNVGLTYHFDEWGIDLVPVDNVSGCTLNITRAYQLELPHGIVRTMELKGTTLMH